MVDSVAPRAEIFVHLFKLHVTFESLAIAVSLLISCLSVPKALSDAGAIWGVLRFLLLSVRIFVHHLGSNNHIYKWQLGSAAWAMTNVLGCAMTMVARPRSPDLDVPPCSVEVTVLSVVGLIVRTAGEQIVWLQHSGCTSVVFLTQFVVLALQPHWTPLAANTQNVIFCVALCIGTCSSFLFQRRLQYSTHHVLLTAEERRFHNFDLAFDLVATMEVVDGVALRTWSSKSHQLVLGHDPAACNGDVRELTHLLTAETIEHDTPRMIAALESNLLPDGAVDEITLLHADGHPMVFEWRVCLTAALGVDA